MFMQIYLYLYPLSRVVDRDDFGFCSQFCHYFDETGGLGDWETGRLGEINSIRARLTIIDLLLTKSGAVDGIDQALDRTNIRKISS